MRQLKWFGKSQGLSLGWNVIVNLVHWEKALNKIVSSCNKYECKTPGHEANPLST